MKERIQKILSARGITSRRKAEELISQGRVSCNGHPCVLGDVADPDTDEIMIDGKPLPCMGERVYIMLNKPRGFVTTLRDEKGRKNAAQLVADCGTRVYPVGRLDMDSEGLLLFTNDGDFANAVMHPKHEVEKTYIVTVGNYSDEALERLRQPVTLDGYTIAAPQVSVISREMRRAVLQVIIHEGRNRQIRRMCAMAGMTVLRLKRIAEGTLKLFDLPKGKWRYLTMEEVNALKEHS